MDTLNDLRLSHKNQSKTSSQFKDAHIFISETNNFFSNFLIALYAKFTLQEVLLYAYLHMSIYSSAPIIDHWQFWTRKRPLLVSTNFWNWSYLRSSPFFLSTPIRRIYQLFWRFIFPTVVSYEGTAVSLETFRLVSFRLVRYFGVNSQNIPALLRVRFRSRLWSVMRALLSPVSSDTLESSVPRQLKVLLCLSHSERNIDLSLANCSLRVSEMKRLYSSSRGRMRSVALRFFEPRRACYVLVFCQCVRMRYTTTCKVYTRCVLLNSKISCAFTDFRVPPETTLNEPSFLFFVLTRLAEMLSRETAHSSPRITASRWPRLDKYRTKIVLKGEAVERLDRKRKF